MGGEAVDKLPPKNIIAVYERLSLSSPDTINFYYRFENYGVLYHTFGIIPEEGVSTEEIFQRWIATNFFGGHIDWDMMELPPVRSKSKRTCKS